MAEYQAIAEAILDALQRDAIDTLHMTLADRRDAIEDIVQVLTRLVPRG